MPPLTRWYIKSALVYLTAALLLAVILALPINLPLFIRYMNPAYFHLFLVGWVTQMIFGVIYWMFPIITRAQPRGNEQLGWASYALLNVGLLLRAIGEPLVSTRPEAGLGWLLAVSALLQWLAAVLFVVLAWPRVKEKYRGE
ncbi:MAG: cbb3-type cytochrome c oxidase subunit I [Anaerolineae bacterium]|nr:cbb3-type cytochrome c oxidase subunit I [Anaerolineae bacterium]